MEYSPHLPTVHIALDRIRSNYRVVARTTAVALAGPEAPVRAAPSLPPGFAGRGDAAPFVWPSQLAVTKADAYGHGHIRVAAALLREGATLFASGSVQESVELRKGLAALPAGEGESEQGRPAIISLLGPVQRDDIFLCAEHGIIPVLHSFEHFSMIEGTQRPLAVAVKCNTGMSRLGFNESEMPQVIERLRKLPGVTPVIALSHLHSGDTEQARAEVRTQGEIYARMLAALRGVWPHLAASLGNSAGTLLAGEIAELIGPHVCRPGVSLYGSNPFNGTSLASLGHGLLPAMSVSAPIIAVRELPAGAGIGYGHTFVAKKAMPVGIVAAGYADCFSRGLSNKGVMCVEGERAPIVGRVSMQMTAVDLSALPAQGGLPRPAAAWILGGPHPNAVTAEELARLWGTITYEVFCLLGYNNRVYGPYPGE